jgi:Immune Mapped Protein 2 (IMP2) N-terminal domain
MATTTAAATTTTSTASACTASTSYSPSSPTMDSPSKTKAMENNEQKLAMANGGNIGPTGCYLVYEPSSGGRLMLHYSQGMVPENAVGFWLPGPHQSIQLFKFKQACGRSELIRGIAGAGEGGKRKYMSGWCQFLKLAKAKDGKVIQFIPEQGLAVDVYGYEIATQQPLQLDLESGLQDIRHLNAIAVVPRHHEFLKGVKTITATNFLDLGNLAGASTTM